MSDLSTAIKIAVHAHEGQTDKAGLPYILHPLRVMLAMETEADRIVAVLHDVAEDHEDGWQWIHEGCFTEAILDAIDSVTRRPGETYEDFIERAKDNTIGRRVKLADLADNMLPGRRASLSTNLLTRYERALASLRPNPPSEGEGK